MSTDEIKTLLGNISEAEEINPGESRRFQSREKWEKMTAAYSAVFEALAGRKPSHNEIFECIFP